MSYQIPRHKVFISYYHKDDQDFKNHLIDLKEYNYNTYKWQSIFDDYSVHEDEIDDTGLTSEHVRKIIRDEYIKEATVMILLCGENTKTRKHIDWEIHAAMFNTDNNPKMGIIVVNLPSISQACRKSDDTEKDIINPNGNWISVKTRKEYEDLYPNIPIRIIDNFESGITDDTIVSITVVNWDRISNNIPALKTLVNNAFNRSRSKELHYNHSRPLKGRNS
jgi:undecaprenyl pyrophosphate synthase